MNPTSLNQWFSLDQQRNYVLKLTGRHGLTRRRAEYFVKLWAYLLLKQQHELGNRLQPLSELSPLQGAIPCTHREAAELFYSHQDRGSDRSAGMMIDQLASLGLIKKKFDGSTICIQIHPRIGDPPPPPKSDKSEPIQLKTDAFNPRIDAVPAANLIVRDYGWLNPEGSPAHRIARLLRGWAEQYLTGMRVLRRCDNGNLVGFYMLYPTARQSEANFFLEPRQSLYLTANTEIDPIAFATPGDRDCSAAFVRAWTIDTPFLHPNNICLFLEDVQQTLAQMQQDFPNLCDMYAIILHPVHDEVRLALGFQKTREDTQLPLYWVYEAIDRFLALDVRQALANLKLASSQDS